MSNRTWDMDWLARVIGYKEVALLEAAEQIQRLEEEVERLSVALIAATTPPEPEPPAKPTGYTDAAAAGPLNAEGLEAQGCSSEEAAALMEEVKEWSTDATLLTDLPITLAPEALNDKTIQ